MSKEKLWIDVVKRFAEESQCRSRKVGAILVRDSKLIAEGWCGAPKDCDESECIRCNMKEQGAEIPSGTSMELSICAHAEANCIANAASCGAQTLGSVMYCTNKPCSECAKIIIGARIKEVKYIKEYDSKYTDLMFGYAGILCHQLVDE